MTKYQKAIESLKKGKGLYIHQTIQNWNYKMADRRHRANKDYSWFICQNKLIVCCHGAADKKIQLRNDVIVDVSWLIKKFKHLAARYNNKIYIDCCYGATKAIIKDGVEIIPVNYSRMAVQDSCWYCESIEDFLNFYKNIVKVFKIKTEIVEVPPQKEFDFITAWTRLSQQENLL